MKELRDPHFRNEKTKIECDPCIHQKFYRLAPYGEDYHRLLGA